jgi:hypothetical protein
MMPARERLLECPLKPAVRLGLGLCVLDVMKEALVPAEAPDVRGLLGVPVVHVESSLRTPTARVTAQRPLVTCSVCVDSTVQTPNPEATP